MFDTRFSYWLEGARPHTWANAFAPVIVGTGAAVHAGSFNMIAAVYAAVVSWLLIIGVNYANDYSDGIRGTDNNRQGPLRLVGSGLAKPEQVKYAAFAAFALAAVFGPLGLEHIPLADCGGHVMHSRSVVLHRR